MNYTLAINLHFSQEKVVQKYKVYLLNMSTFILEP